MTHLSIYLQGRRVSLEPDLEPGDGQSANQARHQKGSLKQDSPVAVNRRVGWCGYGSDRQDIK